MAVLGIKILVFKNPVISENIMNMFQKNYTRNIQVVNGSFGISTYPHP